MAPPLQTFALDGVAIAWDGSTRLLQIDYSPGWHPTAQGARELQARIDAWVDGAGAYDMLVDARGLARVTLLWRLDWTSYMRAHRGRVRIAAYHVPPELDSLIFAFAWATGLPVRTFPEREDAATWLRAGDAAALRGRPPLR